MNSEHMVHMANQIALNFASYPHDEAVANVADHLKKFWEKRMRVQLHQYVASGGYGLHKLVLEAEQRLEKPSPVAPKPVTSTLAVESGLED
jgi:formate dehydrogenase subunit delta